MPKRALTRQARRSLLLAVAASRGWLCLYRMFKRASGSTKSKFTFLEERMKKLLMCSAACALGLPVAHPAKAAGVKLDLAAHFKGYVTWIDNDNESGLDERSFDILRETEIHFTGETTLDNGLTVGVHHEADIDSEYGNFDAFATEESYAY